MSCCNDFIRDAHPRVASMRAAAFAG